MLRTLIVSSYPPDRCGIAKYTVQYAAARRGEGEHVEIVSTKRSAAHHQADMSTWHGLLRVWWLSRRFDRTVVQFFPDLLFRSTAGRQFLPHWPWLALVLGWGKNVEMIVHEAPYDVLAAWPGRRGRLMRSLWRRLFSLPRHTYVHTTWERDQMIAATGVSAAKVELLAHGSSFVRRTDLGREAARAELGLDPDAYHFLAIGFIQPHKGFDRAVQALRRLDGDRAQVHVVGSVRVSVEEADQYLVALRALVDATPGAHLRVEFVSDEEFDRWIVACDALVLPYRRIVSSGVLERAKLYGRPAIVADVGGMRDQASESTLVVADDDELAEAMARLAGVEVTDELIPGSVTPQERVRGAAARLRSRYEAPAGDGAGRERWEPTPALGVPSVEARTPLLVFVKRLVRKLTWWELQPLVRAGVDLREALIAEHEAHLGTKAWLDQHAAEVNGALERLERLRAEDRAELASLRSRSATGRPPAAAGAAPGPPMPPARDLSALYQAHQDAFRGSEADITERLRVYVPRIQAAAQPGVPVLDIGPGRGEWLTLLRDAGVEAYGAEVNSQFVEHAATIGLKMVLADGVEHLRSLPDASLSAVTSFHVVEHLPFEVLVDLVDESLRVLRPGGVILLETPNPTNVTVGASSFWIDPTHVRPVHPALLAFLLEHRGFTEVSIQPVNPPSLPDLHADALNQAFRTGMDVVASGRKAPPPD